MTVERSGETTKEWGPDDLDRAITKSRLLLPEAIDALCEVITETTGLRPSRERVEYVSTFWLMHACDAEIYGQSDGVRQMKVEPDSTWQFRSSRRSRIMALAGTRRAPVRVTDPYLKTSLTDEFLGALRGRQFVRWQSTSSPRLSGADVNVERRASLARQFALRDENSLLRRSVALTAPVELVEQHHTLLAWAKSNVDSRARAMYAANAHQSSTSFRHLLFEQRLTGSKIAIHQHGGGYGIDMQHPGEFHDILIADVFYTWGWNRPDLGNKVKSLATAFPARHRGRPSHHYLLMSLAVTPNFYRLQAFVLPQHIDRVVAETESFVRSLNSAVPLHLRSSGSTDFPMNRLHGSAVSLTKDERHESGSLAASRSKLVVHNYLGTPWLETLAMNVPTVCFYDPSVFRPREAARPFFEQLLRVGVLHHSGAEAARFVNDLNGDPSVWWNKPEVQEAREKFVARYANFKEDWLPGWIEEFERLLEE
jgi:putative transferase (TIGR04331 family)